MRNLIIGCLIVAGLFVLASAAGCWYFFVREAPMLDAGLDLPEVIRVGEAVPLVVRLSNPHDSEVTLDSVDISDTLLERFQVVSIEPEAKDTFHVPLLDQRSWTFSHRVPAGESFAVTFNLRAIAPGHVSGNVDACNPTQDCEQLFVDVVVEPASGPSSDDDTTSASPD